MLSQLKEVDYLNSLLNLWIDIGIGIGSVYECVLVSVVMSASVICLVCLSVWCACIM